MSRYQPDELSRKWQGELDTLLVETRKLWESGRPARRPLPGFTTPLEPDCAEDWLIPKRAHRHLLSSGRVVWGHSARAFLGAYVPGKETFYGSVVYSVTEPVLDDVFELAYQVNELRQDDSFPPEGTEEVATAIRDDSSKFTRIRLPAEIGVKGEAYFANISFLRSRLPLGYLHDRLLPILIAPDKTPWCALLPLRFWPEELRDTWESGTSALPSESVREALRQMEIEP